MRRKWISGEVEPAQGIRFDSKFAARTYFLPCVTRELSGNRENDVPPRALGDPESESELSISSSSRMNRLAVNLSRCYKPSIDKIEHEPT